MLATLGLYPVLLLAGFLGSLVYIAAQEGPPKAIWNIYSPIVAGTLVANYLPHLALTMIFNEGAATGAGGAASAFATGLLGPMGAQMLLRRAKKWNITTNGRSPTA